MRPGVIAALLGLTLLTAVGVGLLSLGDGEDSCAEEATPTPTITVPNVLGAVPSLGEDILKDACLDPIKVGGPGPNDGDGICSLRPKPTEFVPVGTVIRYWTCAG